VRLRSLDIRGFGQLRGIVDLETGRGTVALLLERNEAGKSTLAAAITAALYGLDSNRTRHRNRLTPIERYRPWGGGSYGLELVLERYGRELKIARDFERQTVEVVDGAHDVTAEFRRGKRLEVGEILTGLTRAQFELSAFVPQGKIVWDDASSLAEALQRAADSQSGENTAAAAIEVLDAALDEYTGVSLKKGKVETEIRRCADEVARLGAELATLEERRGALDAEIDHLRRLESADDEARVRRDALRLRRAATELEFESAALQADDERRARRDELRTLLAGDPTLELLTDEVRREVDSERRRHEILLSKLQDLESELARAGEERAAARRRIDVLPLDRIPSADQVTELYAWIHTRNEIQTAREQLLAGLDQERTKVTRAGFDAATAQRLGERFGSLTDRDRGLLSGLRKRRLELDDEDERIREKLCGAKEELLAIGAAQDRRRRVGLIVLSVGLLLAAAGIVGAGLVALQQWAGSIPGAAVLAFGVYLAVGAGSYRGGSERAARTRQEEQGEELRRLEAVRGDLDAELGALAAQVKCSPEELEESWRAWLDLQPHTSGLSVFEERLAGLEGDEQRLVGNVRSLETIVGRIPSLSDLDGIYEMLKGAREAADRAEAAERTRADLDGRVARQLAEIGASEEASRTRLRGFGIAATGALEGVFEEFDQRAARAAEMARLREGELPQLERQIAPPRKRAEREERVRELGSRIAEAKPVIERELAGLGTEGRAILETLATSLTEEELQGELRALESGIERRHEATTRQLTEVRTFIDRYEREAPLLRDRIEELEEAGRRANEFNAAVRLARDTLESLALQTHQVWSRELAAHTNRTLKAMGSDIGQVEFDEELNLTLVQRGQRMSGTEARQALSTGARDLLHLACRIALAHFLSGGDLDLPLVLDDPFAHCDDPRTVAGMRLLVDAIAPEHQVILLACQRNRYEWVRLQIEDSHRIRTLGLEDQA
jgi:energy-coupling factor transporter ATP-binding protein EcfA2